MCNIVPFTVLQVSQSLKKTFVVHHTNNEAIASLFEAVGVLRSLLTVGMGSVEESKLKDALKYILCVFVHACVHVRISTYRCVCVCVCILEINTTSSLLSTFLIDMHICIGILILIIHLSINDLYFSILSFM